ncbi:hypothetical protein H4R20_007132 [Coemansia guatemalensis]|uniref:Uncharacterized protein n=1 Tax=Coemansia guatemalensis TaxID=2761395 RepID=A0A9W8HLH8_9FUNG|nr:hypothetical protein H4R20_007132 [Coemansia guatemalensis]
MKFSSIASSIVLAASLAAGLSDKEKRALTTFNSRYHPSDHSANVLISELSEYAGNAGLSSASSSFGKRQYAQAAQDLSSHVRQLSTDPLVQHGKQFAEPFMMLNDCVNELHSLYK